jgi:16S rRNA processing protein RimM
MRVIVGRIGRPHGIRGEAVVGVRTDEPDLRFAVGSSLGVGTANDGTPSGRLTVAATRWHSGSLLVVFDGITDRTAAGALSGNWLSVDAADLPPTADPEEFRDHELVGLSVRTVAGDQIGVVSDVLHYGQDLLVIQDEGPGRAAREHLVPFVASMVPEVDVAAGIVVIDPPPGLLDTGQAELWACSSTSSRSSLSISADRWTPRSSVRPPLAAISPSGSMTCGGGRRTCTTLWTMCRSAGDQAW